MTFDACMCRWQTSRTISAKTSDKFIAEPSKAAGKCVPKLEILQSPYRYVLHPMVDYVLKVEKESEIRKVCVLVPELVVRHWWEDLLHNRRADLLKVILLMRGTGESS